MRKTVVDQLAEEDDDEVDQKTRWLLEMLPRTQQQHQMIAPVFRWAVDSERDRRRCSEEVEERVKEVKAEKEEASAERHDWLSGGDKRPKKDKSNPREG